MLPSRSKYFMIPSPSPEVRYLKASFENAQFLIEAMFFKAKEDENTDFFERSRYEVFSSY